MLSHSLLIAIVPPPSQSNWAIIRSLIPSTVSLIVTTAISVLVGVYLERFKNKLIFLKYNISFNPLGATIKDNYWGNIQVTHNGRVTNHLSLVTIDIKNDSNNDVPNELYLDIWVDGRSQILGLTAYYDTGAAIWLENNYFTRLQKVYDQLDEDAKKTAADPNYTTPDELRREIDWVQTNKKFTLPIFNRNSSIKINLLVENFSGNVPTVTPSILQPSVKLIKQIDSDTEKKNKNLQISIYVFVLNLVGLTYLAINFTSNILLIAYTVLVGALSYFVGRFIYNLIRFAKRMFW